MKKKIGILFLLLLVFIIALAPARLVHHLIPTNGEVSIGSIVGTVWSGTIENVAVKQWQVRGVNYSLDLIPVLGGSIGGQTNINDGDVIGQFEFYISDQNNLELHNANLSLKAVQLESLLPFPGIELAGDMKTEELSLVVNDRKVVMLSGASRWTDGRVTMNNRQWLLGEFIVDWSTDQSSKFIVGQFRKTKNMLDIDGIVTISAAGMLEFKGSISDNIDKNVYAALSLFADGKVEQGRLPIKFKKKVQ